MEENTNCVVIIPAGGIGKRFGGQIPKQYIDVLGIPIIIHTLMIFDQIPEIKDIVIAIDPEWLSFVDNKILKYKLKKTPIFVKGGKERQESVYNCTFLEQVIQSSIILVHDAVRPCASVELIKRIIQETIKHGAVVPALQPKETIKLIDDNGFIDKTIPRTRLRNAQTPQGFKTELFISAYRQAFKNEWNYTDDSSLIEKLGNKVKIIDGEETNIKITSGFDICITESIIRKFKQSM